MERVSPEQPGGVRDYLPDIMIPRQGMIDTIRRVFESYGFDPLDTPGLERFEVLSGGDPGFSKAIWMANVFGKHIPSAGHRTALRFDLTVPLARVVAANPQLPMPFKRYAQGKVWRGEQPQAGRYREFMQFDVDIVGSASTQADVEIVQIICAVLTALQVGGFTVRINNRKVLNGLSALATFGGDQTTKVLQILDKMDKVGWVGVSQELAGNTDTQKESPCLTDDQIGKIKEFVDLQTSNPFELIDKAYALFAGNATATAGLDELLEIARTLQILRIPQDQWVIDFSVARGLGYYTGPVFEASLDDLPEIGSVFGGGRYDGLVENFVDRPVPATGASAGVDRLFAALEKLGKIDKRGTMLQALIFVVDKEEETRYTQLATELRQAGIRSSVYLGSDRAFKAQLAYAAKIGVPLVIICGPRERQADEVTIKNMRDRTQVTVGRVDWVETAKRLI